MYILGMGQKFGLFFLLGLFSIKGQSHGLYRKENEMNSSSLTSNKNVNKFTRDTLLDVLKQKKSWTWDQP